MFDSNFIQVSNTIVSVNRFRETFSSELIIERKNRQPLTQSCGSKRSQSGEQSLFNFLKLVFV